MPRSCSSSDMNAAFMQYRAALAGRGAVVTRQAGLAGREVVAVPGCNLRQRSSLGNPLRGWRGMPRGAGREVDGKGPGDQDGSRGWGDRGPSHWSEGPPGDGRGEDQGGFG